MTDENLDQERLNAEARAAALDVVYDDDELIDRIGERNVAAIKFYGDQLGLSEVDRAQIAKYLENIDPSEVERIDLDTFDRVNAQIQREMLGAKRKQAAKKKAKKAQAAARKANRKKKK